MTHNVLKNRRYVKKYDQTAEIPESLIDSMLRDAWEVTPSKNNFMPYTIHVIGPDRQDYKEKIFQVCLANEGKVDQVETSNLLDDRYKGYLPQYSNMLTCSYLLVFTMRLETEPNPFQKRAIDNGHRFEAVDETRLNLLHDVTSFEAGMFCDAFSGMCLEHGIDVSFTGCFGKKVEDWKDVPFVTRKPIMIMSVGKGLVYRNEGINQFDLRPNYERIVNFVK